MKDFGKYSALELGKMIKNGEATSPEICAYFLEKEDKYNAFVSKNKNVIKEAENVQRLIENGEINSPLAGVPVAVKDNICTKDINTTCASKMLESFVPPYDATAVKKLKNAGMLILGKTNMDEFAMGSTGETSFFGAALNPRDITKAAGGSSSGSAAAVAGELAPLALGSDTGGSVRMPAAYCSLYGLKPTYGAVSRYGLIAYASSLDTVGTICKTAEDTEALYTVISGNDEKDSTSRSAQALPEIPESLRELSFAAIGLTECKPLENACRVETVDFSLADYAVPAYYIIACAEASSNLARYDGIRLGYRADDAENLAELYTKSRTQAFGAEVKKRIMLGNFVLSKGYYDEYYLKALKVKNLIYNAVNELLDKHGYIIAPVAKGGAPELGKSLENPLDMYESDVYNVLANLTGLPSVSLPSGIQIIGKEFSENALIKIASLIEREK